MRAAPRELENASRVEVWPGRVVGRRLGRRSPPEAVPSVRHRVPGKIVREEAKALAKLVGAAGMGAAQVPALNERFFESMREAAFDRRRVHRASCEN